MDAANVPHMTRTGETGLICTGTALCGCPECRANGLYDPVGLAREHLARRQSRRNVLTPHRPSCADRQRIAAQRDLDLRTIALMAESVRDELDSIDADDDTRAMHDDVMKVVDDILHAPEREQRYLAAALRIALRLQPCSETWTTQRRHLVARVRRDWQPAAAPPTDQVNILVAAPGAPPHHAPAAAAA